MKIIFICGSLEPGRDGVGDYVRRLATELIRQMHLCAAISLYDTCDVKEARHVGNMELPVLRLSAKMPVKLRLKHAKTYIDKFDPDWLSLQFVIFGFHPKGLPFNLGSKLATLGRYRRWHIMFHELWIGESKADSLKLYFWGKVQKMIIKNLISKIKPEHFSTSNKYYQTMLNKNGVSSVKHCVFSNIPFGNKSGKLLFNKLPDRITQNRNAYVIAGFFGTIHLDENLNLSFSKLQKLVYSSGKNLVVTHVGKATEVSGLWKFIQVSENDFIYEFGEQEADNIADYFCQIDIGLSTYPKFLFEKSGSIAAMLNNNLPVILLRQNYELDDCKFDYVTEIQELDKLDEFITQTRDFGVYYGVAAAALKYNELLNNINLGNHT